MPKSLWAPLVWHRVADISALAEKLVATLPQGNAELQIRSRRITQISIEKTAALDCVYLTNKNPPSFRILMGPNTPEQWITIIGHEIGHTFGILGLRPKSISRSRAWPLHERMSTEEELFCDEFAKRWRVLNNNQQALKELLVEKYSYCITRHPRGRRI